jgi:hypothetical protein
MPRKISSTMVCFSALLAISGFALAAGLSMSDFVGTWTMNASKSTFSGSPLKSYTVTITDTGGGTTHTVVHWTDPDGTQGQLEYSGDASGKAAPASGDPSVDAVRLKASGPGWVQLAFLKGGKTVEHGKYTLASDGKSMHAVEGGVYNGKKYSSDIVLERQ